MREGGRRGHFVHDSPPPPPRVGSAAVLSLCLLSAAFLRNAPPIVAVSSRSRADCVVVPFGMQSMLRSLGVPPMASLDPLAKALLISTETLAVLLVLFLHAQTCLCVLCVSVCGVCGVFVCVCGCV